MTLRDALVVLLNSVPEDAPWAPEVIAVGIQVLARELSSSSPLHVYGADDPLEEAEDALRLAWAHTLRAALQFHAQGVTAPESVKRALALTAKTLLTLQGGTR